MKRLAAFLSLAMFVGAFAVGCEGEPTHPPVEVKPSKEVDTGKDKAKAAFDEL